MMEFRLSLELASGGSITVGDDLKASALTSFSVELVQPAPANNNGTATTTAEAANDNQPVNDLPSTGTH
jgi:hypothetical protein